MHNRRTVFVLGRSYLDGGNEVLLSVCSEFTYRQLRAGQDDGFAQILEHEAEGRSRESHRVGAMQDDKTVEPVIVVGNDANQFPPVFKPHIARLAGRT